jgi:oligopeptide/dipeptide ABC transporter ATP-binding protein
MPDAPAVPAPGTQSLPTERGGAGAALHASARPLIEAQQLRKLFPVNSGLLRGPTTWITAVDGIDFAVDTGETFGLVGESGCGKSTTARLILRLEQPTAGTVQFEGQDIFRLRGDALRAYRRALQVVFQDPTSSLSPRMRVQEIVGEPLIANEAAPRRVVLERSTAALQEVGLPADALTRFPHEFSGGQRQRIAIARALVSGSRCLVLDEPVSALDISIRAQILNLLKRLQQQHQLTYLLISHDLAAVRYLSTRIGVMYLGKLVEIASTATLYAAPGHPYTRALLAAVLPPRPETREPDIELADEVPSARNVPSGCRFHPRCPYAQALCAQVEPPLREVAPGRRIACHFAEQLEQLPPTPK